MLQLKVFSGTRAALCAGLLCLGACDETLGPTSDNALDQSVENSDDTLLGAWYGEIDGTEAYLRVEATRGGALQTIIVGQQNRSGGADTWGELHATPARIDRDGYLSVKLDKIKGKDAPENDGYLIIRYNSRDHRHVALYSMDPDLIAKAIKTGGLSGPNDHRISADPRELVKFIEDAGGQSLFSVQIGYLERVPDTAFPSVKR